jgi:hypothetical protein
MTAFGENQPDRHVGHERRFTGNNATGNNPAVGRDMARCSHWHSVRDTSP